MKCKKKKKKDRKSAKAYQINDKLSNRYKKQGKSVSKWEPLRYGKAISNQED